MACMQDHQFKLKMIRLINGSLETHSVFISDPQIQVFTNFIKRESSLFRSVADPDPHPEFWMPDPDPRLQNWHLINLFRVEKYCE
jgi:hypothetical protein